MDGGPATPLAAAAAGVTTAATALPALAATTSAPAGVGGAAPPSSPPLPADLRQRAAIGRTALVDVLRASRAYDIMPESGKVIVFDVEIPLRFAYYALVEHDAACAPLWDASVSYTHLTLPTNREV